MLFILELLVGIKSVPLCCAHCQSSMGLYKRAGMAVPWCWAYLEILQRLQRVGTSSLASHTCSIYSWLPTGLRKIFIEAGGSWMPSLGLAGRHKWLLIPEVAHNVSRRLRKAKMPSPSFHCQNVHSRTLEENLEILWMLISIKGTRNELEASVHLYVFLGNLHHLLQ